MSTINFYRKETVLNDILNNKNIITVSNNQLNKMLLTAKNDKSNYIISYSLEIDDPNLDYTNNSNDLTKLYSSYYGIDPSIKNEEIKKNIKLYNNCKKSLNSDYEYVFGTVASQQDGEKYIDYNLRSIPHSLIFDYTYNSLYYLQYNKLNLMSYSISLKNGFNYNNHMLYFNIDNNYIKSVNNTLYYDFNKIRETTKQSSGISQIDDQYINTKNNNYNYNKKYNNIITLNKDFKYDIFVTLNRLKNLYNTCENIYDIFSYYNTIGDYNNDYLNLFEYDNNPTGEYKYNYPDSNGSKVNFYGITYKHTLNEIKFEDSKLYITDTQLGIYNQDISYEDTIYISDLSNVSFKMELPTYAYINAYNYSYYKSDFSLIVDNNINTTISYVSNYKFYTKKTKTNFIEYSKSVFENQVSNIKTMDIEHTFRYLIGKTYNIKLNSTIDNNIFKNSGINIIYKGALYLNNEEEVEIIKNSISYYINPENPDASFDDHKIINYETRTFAYYNHNQITLPIKKELNIRKIDGDIINNYKAKPSCNKKYFSQNSYFILSSKNLFDFSYINNLINNLDTNLENVNNIDGIYIYPNDDNIPQNNIIKIKIKDGSKVPITTNGQQIIGPEGWDNPTTHDHGIQNSVEPEEIKLKQGKIRINDDLFKALEKNNLIINGNDINNLHYYMIKPKYDKSNNSKYNEIYPVLNTYPNKYLNDKFFDSEAYKYTNYINDEELNTCIAEIKNIKYDDIDILYLYEIIDDYIPQYVTGGPPIRYYRDGYKLIFYTLVKNNNSQDNLKITKCEDSDGGHILSKYDLYYDNIVDKDNIFFTKDNEFQNLYRYLKLYLNNSIRFY